MWKKLKLADVCTLRNGRAYKKPELLAEGKYRVLRVGNFFTSKNWYYSDLELDDTKYCDNGDLLYAWSASFGARLWEGEKVIYHYHIWRVDINEEIIDKRFLFYWFEFDKELIKSASGTGTTMMHVSKSSMEKREISLPPLAEQQRIVAKLDAAFSEIDTAIGAAQKCVENSKMIFQTLRNDIYQEVVDTAPNVELETIAKLSRGHNPPKSKFIDVPKDGYVRFYQIRDAKSDKFATYVPDDSKLHKVTERDFLMNAYRYVGEVFRGVSGAFNVALCKLAIIDFEKVNEDYLYYMVPSHLIKGELLKTSARSLIPSMSVKELAKLKVPIPSFEEQKAISTKIIDLEKQHIVLLNIYKKKLYQLNNLKAAILAQELQSEAA
jgi:type I restriction enzyme, S subunit